MECNTKAYSSTLWITHYKDYKVVGVNDILVSRDDDSSHVYKVVLGGAAGPRLRRDKCVLMILEVAYMYLTELTLEGFIQLLTRLRPL